MSNKSKQIRPYLSTGEISLICHVSRVTVFNWIRDGKLKASRVPGGRYRIFRRDFLIFLKKANLLPLLEESNLLHKTRILIVDDKPEIIEALKIFIEHACPNFHITGTTSGFSAGQLVLSFKPDIVILDLIMPDVDGFAVCKKIKSDPLTRNIRVIIMTGYPTEENIEKIKKAGADAVFAKPFDYNELLKEISGLS